MEVYRNRTERLCPRVAASRLRLDAAAGDTEGVLLRAAELEGAYADAGSGEAARWAEVTEAAAAAFVARRPWQPGPCPEPREGEVLWATPPEGFVHYGLAPRDYEAPARALAGRAEEIVVVGVRTIGTALSAVVAATLRQWGAAAHRYTVRPGGHPFRRTLTLPAPLRDHVREAAPRGAWCCVVDEGPGLSGSTFLAVAEALEAAGAPPERVMLMPSHRPDPTRLVAPEAARRWGRFALECAATPPSLEGVDVSGGRWRAALLLPGAPWPAVWPETERRKALASDGATLRKLEGRGPWSLPARARAHALAAAGLGPAIAATDAEGITYAVAGRPLGEAPPGLLPRAAEYLSFRARSFAAAVSPEDEARLEAMVRVNVEALGGALGGPLDLRAVVPCICDGRLALHEWVTRGDRLVKTDAIWHGDDHFFPGPCDLAWDVAGAVTEWNLTDAEAAAFTAEVAARVHDPSLGSRLPAWKVAYAASRAAHTFHAHRSTADAAEGARLEALAARYRAALARSLTSLRCPPRTGARAC